MIFGKGVKAIDEFILNAEPQYDDKDAGSTWKPIRHGNLLQAIHAEALERGWLGPMSTNCYSLSNDFMTMAAAFTFKRMGCVGVPEQTRYAVRYGIGVINSNNRRRSLIIYAGAVINDFTRKPFGVITIRLNDTARHTTGVDIRSIVGAAMDRFNLASDITSTFLMNMEMHKMWSESERLMMMMARRKNIPWSALRHADAFLRGTEYSGFDVLRALALTIQQNSPLRQMDDLESISALLPDQGLRPKILQKKRA